MPVRRQLAGATLPVSNTQNGPAGVANSQAPGGDAVQLAFLLDAYLLAVCAPAPRAEVALDGLTTPHLIALDAER